jgi:hypothetical protein
MNDPQGVEVFDPLCYTRKLISYVRPLFQSRELKGLTNSRRLARGWLFTYSLISPLSIHGETSETEEGLIHAPRKERTLG